MEKNNSNESFEKVTIVVNHGIDFIESLEMLDDIEIHEDAKVFLISQLKKITATSAKILISYDRT